MRILSTAASAVFVAMALTAAAAVPADPIRSPGSSAMVSVAAPVAPQVGPTQVGSVQIPGASLAATGITQGAPHGGFGWPLSPRPEVVRRFDQPLSQWSSGHRGVDLLAAVGQPVLSAGDGIVAFSGVVASRGATTVRHAGGLRTTFEPVDERLAAGTVVHLGTPIGVISPSPGHCAPRHCLHWGAISGQSYRDPLSLLGLGRPILLPLG